ncbi:MAG: polyprenyl synthetase family protein [Actinobacteria bacterium HGW-Actinobacteria-2]|nr:MAG: polyprenyl synthetase family protein [Actinobacteria bacterium HGW-Actinobacteria-2]
MVILNPADPLAADFRAAVSRELTAFLDGRTTALAALGPETATLVDTARAFTDGGKRLRPAFCCWGYAAATGSAEVPDYVIRAAASLDLLHVAALVHDDVMDGSATRRGLPAVHVQYADAHARSGGRGSSADFGRAAAILLGDLLLLWSEHLFAGCGAPADRLAAAAPLAALVREEVNAGQFLDVTAQTRPPLDARHDPASVDDQIRRVVEFKTARYTVIRPLQIGAALGGASPELLDTLARFGSPLGRGFQFRDDILGVFGDEAVTGKPAGDDLREGKLTVLVANAMAAARESDALDLDELLGRELSAAQVTRARQIIACSGALAATEHEIGVAAQQALNALADSGLPAVAADGLTALVALSTDRQA